MVSKCCFCFDLRFGYYTYAIVIVGLRISILCFSYLYLPFMCSSNIDTCGYFMTGFGWYCGWLVTSVLFCFLTIVGIIQERSIIIYPYIIMLITELTVITIMLLFAAIFFNMFYSIIMIMSVCIGSYDLWCLISLYKKVKKTESTSYLLGNSSQDI